MRLLDDDTPRIFDDSPAGTGSAREYVGTAVAVLPADGVEVCELLNQCLINCIDLRLQCKQAQWDVNDPRVDALASLFAHMAAAIEIYADHLAARIAVLGRVADGTLETVAVHSGLASFSGADVRDFRHVDEVASALAVAACVLRSDAAVMADCCDSQTTRLLHELAEGLESHCAALKEFPLAWRAAGPVR